MTADISQVTPRPPVAAVDSLGWMRTELNRPRGNSARHRNRFDVKGDAFDWANSRADSSDPFGTIRQCFAIVASACHLIEDDGSVETRDMLIAAIVAAAMRGGAATHAVSGLPKSWPPVVSLLATAVKETKDEDRRPIAT